MYHGFEIVNSRAEFKNMLNQNEPLASFENLRVEFDTKDGRVVAVEDISFQIKPQQTVCLVGESGSGKSVTAKSIMKLNPGNTSYNEDAEIISVSYTHLRAHET